MTRSRSDSVSQTQLIRRRSRLLFRAVATVLACALFAQVLHAAIAADAPAPEAPDFVLKSTGGSNVRLSEYRSDVVAIAFVADWCGDCAEQLRILDHLRARYPDRGLQVLAVRFGAGAAPAPAGITVLADADGETGRLYDIDDLPAVALVARDGRLAAIHDDGRLVGPAVLSSALDSLVSD